MGMGSDNYAEAIRAGIRSMALGAGHNFWEGNR